VTIIENTNKNDNSIAEGLLPKKIRLGLITFELRQFKKHHCKTATCYPYDLTKLKKRQHTYQREGFKENSM